MDHRSNYNPDEWESVWHGRECLDPYLRAEAAAFPPHAPTSEPVTRARLTGRTIHCRRPSVHQVNMDTIAQYFENLPVGEWATAWDVGQELGSTSQALGRPLGMLIARGVLEKRRHWNQNMQRVWAYRRVQ